jgi:hypothetical protein
MSTLARDLATEEPSDRGLVLLTVDLYGRWLAIRNVAAVDALDDAGRG